jgi:hypothetical protein
MSRAELLGRLGRYPSQSPSRPDELAAEERRQDHLQTGEEEGPFPVADRDAILTEPASEDGAQLWMNAVVTAHNERAKANVKSAQMTRDQRLGREVALAIESRVSELEAEQSELGPEQYEAAPEETAALTEWLDDDGDEQDDEDNYDEEETW